jgi:tRNA pseudouridine13 synthase
MKIKIKALPEDFIVEELVDLPLVKQGAFAVYLLKKKGWNTLDLLVTLSRRLAVPFGNFSYGGKKDRHSLSSQYIGIKKKGIMGLDGNGYSLEFIGFMERPMGPDLIRGNHFKIMVRDLTSCNIKACLRQVELAQAFGYANYFDDQRFGCLAAGQGFLAGRVLKGEFNGALKIYLTACGVNEAKEQISRKRFFFEKWRDWEACRKEAKTIFEKKAFSHLARYPKGFLDLLKGIPAEELSMHIASFQSYLWNQMLREIITSICGSALKGYPGQAGGYLFYTQVSPKDLAYLSGLSLPVAGPKVKFTDRACADIYARVLESEGIKGPMFNKWRLRQAYFKSFPRQAVVKPQGLLPPLVLDDEVYIGKRKLSLEFTLPRGSYATMFLKRIFSGDYKV